MPKPIIQFLEQQNVSHETFSRLTLYHDLLCKWQSKINLVGSDTVSDIWHRHFLDSLQLIPLLPDFNKCIVDFGTGAGFPGMVLAMCGYTNIHLIESDLKKIIFLKEIARIANIEITIHHGRIEDQKIENVEVILSRALTNLNMLLEYASKFVSRETTYLFHKGKNYSKEIEEAKKNWSFEVNIIPSITDNQGVVLKLSQLRRYYDGS